MASFFFEGPKSDQRNVEQIREARIWEGEKKAPDVGWKTSCHFLKKSVVSIVRKGEIHCYLCSC